MYNINSEYKNFKFNKIKSGASKKIFYRLQKDNKSFILTDFNLDKKEYLNHLKIYNILKDLDISIPEIYESNNTDLFTISEDFGNLRFDKIINNEPIDKLLFYAVDSLKIINHSLQFNSDLNLPIYNYKNFEDEIMELPKYFLPYLYNNLNENISEEYLLEYGTDSLEIDISALSKNSKVVLVDDLIATGGTAIAAGNLIKKLDAKIYEYSFLVNLPNLGGSKKLIDNGNNVYSLMEFDGE